MNYKLITIIIISLVIILAAWYIYSTRPLPYVAPTTNPPAVFNAPTNGDTTTDITNSLNQAPSDGSASNELDSLDQSVDSL